MSRAALALAALPAALALTLGGCGGDGGNRLGGSAGRTYDLAFDRVEVQRQERSGALEAVIVRYVRQPAGRSAEIPVKIVARTPIEVGKPVDLVKQGAVTRVVSAGQGFPPLARGQITFEELGGDGGRARGRFFATFASRDGATLDGEFDAPVTRIGAGAP